MNEFFFFFFVSYVLVDLALAKLKHSPGVWVSLPHTHPLFLLYLTCRRRIVTKCTVLEKADPCCGESQWNGLPTSFQFTIGMSIDMPMGFVFFFRIS